MLLKISAFLSFFLTSAALWADGGTLRISQTVGERRIAVFTSPTPPLAGPIDISVFVTNGSGEVDTAIRVKVIAFKKGSSIKRISKTASNEAATNKLLQAAILELPEPGIWEVFVTFGDSEVTFDLEVAESLPAWWHLAGWIAWPLLAVVLFVLHRWLGEIRKRKEIDFQAQKRDLESPEKFRSL